MPVAKVVTAQRDFTGGEADPALKRADDHPLQKTSARQMRNYRMLNTRGLANRQGRRVLGLESPRVDQVMMSPTNTFYLVFGNAYVRVYNAAFAKVFEFGGLTWSTATAKNVNWDIFRLSIFVTFAGMQPFVLTWDGVSQVSTWTFTLYNEQITSGGQKRTMFYRIAAPGVTMTPSATTGAITISFSAPIGFAGRVGTYMRYCGRQMVITAVITDRVFNALVLEPLPVAEDLFFATSPTTVFNVGDEVIGQSSNAKGLVTFVGAGPAGQGIGVQLLQQTVTPSTVAENAGQIAYGFINGEYCAGPGGSLKINAEPIVTIPQPLVVWDEEVMNPLNGYPASVFVDQNRLGFCDFPAVPGGIAWSAVGNPYDLYVDAQPANAIFELAPRKSRVLYVVPGPEGAEFVFCDNAVYSIPINQSNPLKPGSVAFNTLVSEGAATVKPRALQQSIVYVSAGYQQLKAVQAIGAYNRPYIVDDISENHAHLLATPVSIAAPGGSDQFEESYFYVQNADGTIILCKYSIVQGVIDVKTLGFLPWSGNGTATWISALVGQSDVLVAGTYAPNGIAPVSVVEVVDATKFLDASILYNSVPTALTPPGGKGPLWWIAGGTVDLMDGGRMMGTYAIDANGFLVAQNNAGENFLSATLAAGQAWTATLEPWVPAVQPGQDINQRMRKRRVMRFETYVTNSTGFTMNRLFGGPVTRTSPVLGTIMSRRRIEAWNQDDDPTLTPPLREQSYSIRPIGRNHDPRVAIIKDTPGPLSILEVDLEVTV